MIELDGIEFIVKTPAENTQDLVDYCNSYCQTNNVRNSKGDVVFIAVNFSSPIYLLFWSVGYLATVIQKLLYSIGKQFSVASSSPKQLLNIASIAGLQLRPATYTTVRAVVFAASTGTCTITTDLSITVTVNGQNYIFHPLFMQIIPANQSSVIILQADVLGSVILNANSLTSFDSDVPNFESMISDASVPGRDQESYASLRQRLLSRQNASSGLDQLVQALRNLSGVAACNVLYNSNTNESLIVGSLTIPPRSTAIFIQGYNPDIAKTYFSYTDRPVVSDPSAIEQQYHLLNGQVFSVYLIPPTTVPLFAKVYTEQEVPDSVKRDIYQTIASSAMHLDIGDPLSITQLVPLFDVSWGIVGVELSVDGVTYSYRVSPGPNGLLSFPSENVEVMVAS